MPTPSGSTPRRLTALPDQSAAPRGRFNQTYLRRLLRRGVLEGQIEAEEEEWVMLLAAEGADLQADINQLTGKTYMKNYGSAEKDRAAVTAALLKRVTRKQTLGPYLWEGTEHLPFASARVVPLGSV